MAAKKKISKKVSTKKSVSEKSTKSKKLKVKKNYLVMVLDESGSMASIKKEAISAYNEQLDAVKKSKGKLKVSVSLVKFSDEASFVFKNESIENATRLNEENYRPHAFTAMYDGVGSAIAFLKSMPDINDDDVTVLMLIISDGAENSSKIYNAGQVSDMIKELQATNRWTFTYAGANQDLSKIQSTLHIPAGNTSIFAATAQGMSANNVLRSKGISMTYASYNSGRAGGQSVSNFYNPDDSGDGTDSVKIVPLVGQSDLKVKQ